MSRPSAALRFSRPAQQRRAERTTEAVAVAALRALRTRDYEQVSVAELAEAAGISVGGFYARFENKEALLPVLAAHVLDDCRDALDRALDAVADGSIEDVVGAYARTMVEMFRAQRHALIQLRRHARSDRKTAVAVREFNDHVHGRLRALLQARRTLIGHPDPDVAIEFGLFAASASAREAVLADSLSVYRARIDDARLVAEVTRTWIAYLSPVPTSRRSPRGRKP